MKTGNAKVDEFFAELDRRISSPDSTHPEDSRERMRKMRAGLAVFAANDPATFELHLEKVLETSGFTLADFQPDTAPQNPA